jgi:hypothetical protein
MRILAFIEDREVIKAILKHLGLLAVKSKPTPKAHAPPAGKQSGSGPTGYVLDHFCQLSLLVAIKKIPELAMRVPS